MKKRAEKNLEGKRRIGGESRANDAFKILYYMEQILNKVEP